MRQFKIFWESIRQAVQELNGNKLRSFLSSLGITIGIFCIIAVLSAVDSLKQNIQDSFEKLGNDVLYIDRQPWTEDGRHTWWKYAKRPAPDYSDFEALKEQVKSAQYACLTVFIPGRTIEYGSSHVRGAYMAGVTYDYADLTKLEFDAGRYFTSFEHASGANRVILGYKLAHELFRGLDPVGRTVKIAGQKFQVIGVVKEEGKSIVNIFEHDQAIIIGYHTAKKIVNVSTGRTWGTMLNIKAKPGVDMADFRDEVTGTLRAHRKLRPKEEDNFAINELSMFTEILDAVFGMMKGVGFIIGFFAIIVGGFSVANIMFVSVKERTNLIGIKKALGAKRGVILLEFLIEGVLLCIAGGILGLAVVMVVLKLISGVFHYEMFLSATNVFTGIFGAIFIGIVAGFIPALQAARMDPVEAIRK